MATLLVEWRSEPASTSAIAHALPDLGVIKLAMAARRSVDQNPRHLER